MGRQLTSAKLVLRNNYIEFIFVGDCVALEMEISGDVILERQLDYTYNIMNSDKKVIIFNLNNNPLPNKIFKYVGNVKIGKCLCADALGNKVEAFQVKGHKPTNKMTDLDSNINKMSDFYIQDLTNIESTKFKRGLKIIPKRAFKEQKAEQFNDVANLEKTSQRAIKLKAKKPIKTKGTIKGY